MLKHFSKSGIFLCLTAVISFGISIAAFVNDAFRGQGRNITTSPLFARNSYAEDRQQFLKEGELIFRSANKKKSITKIDIEIADTAYERTRGLMHRRSLPDGAGMIFIFERPGPRSFWMRNTYIPLDIIFADEKKKIITIHKKTKPLSYDLIRSTGDVKYVVEVNAGFCDRHGISVGDFIEFKRDS